MKFQIVRFDANNDTVHPFGGHETMRGQWSLTWDATERYFTVELATLDDLLALATHTQTRVQVLPVRAPDLPVLELIERVPTSVLA